MPEQGVNRRQARSVSRHINQRRTRMPEFRSMEVGDELLGIHRRTLYRLTKRYGIPLGKRE